MDFQDKIVVITGGSQGLGKGLAKAFAQKKAQVVIASNDAQALAATAKELSVEAFACDVTSRDDLQALVDYALKQHGRIDVWINNAGIQIAPSNVEDVNIQKLQQLFDVNFFGYFYGCQTVVPVMRKQGKGVIININSSAGLEGKPGLSAYVSSKFAVKGLTESVRQELNDTDVQVFGIHPGGIQTEIYKEQYPADFNAYMSVDYVVQKIMDHFAASTSPEPDLIIRRPK
jgi:NAD(P)-dependent dehydrogenase (short-subunit alcohol dehydrogenase family)